MDSGEDEVCFIRDDLIDRPFVCAPPTERENPPMSKRKEG